MVVERIKITGDRIVTKDTSNNTTFDTNRRYLKSDSSGQLLVGGFTRAPIIGGSSGTQIYDHANAGGFIVSLGIAEPIPLDPDTGLPDLSGAPRTLEFLAPAFDTLTVDIPKYYDGNLVSIVSTGQTLPFKGNARNIGTYSWSLYSYMTTTSVQSNDRTYNRFVSNYIFNIDNVTLSESFEGGTLTFPWPGVDNYVYTDGTSVYSYITYLSLYVFQAMLTPALYCSKAPSNLALAVTP